MVKKPSWRDLADSVTAKASAVKDAAARSASYISEGERAKKVIATASESARHAAEVTTGVASAGAAVIARGAKAAGVGVGTAAARAKEFAQKHPELIKDGLDLALELMPGSKPASKLARFALRAARNRMTTPPREGSARPKDESPKSDTPPKK